MKKVKRMAKSTRVGVADLKAHLSEYLRRVRGGTTLTLMDRQTPIARLSPIDSPNARLPHRPAVGLLADLQLPEPASHPERDVLLDLLEERQRHR